MKIGYGGKSKQHYNTFLFDIDPKERNGDWTYPKPAELWHQWNESINILKTKSWIHPNAKKLFQPETHQEALGLRVEERIANAICKNPRIMKAGITLEFKEVIAKVRP